MNKVLLIDISSTLRKYLTKKLHDVGIFVLYAHNFKIALEYLQKSSISLIIIEHNVKRDVLFDFFEKKRVESKITSVPTILLANDVNKTEAALLNSYKVKKVLSKPVKVDEFFYSIGSILPIEFHIDTTPCKLDVRVNENVIFAELAQGLNRDKLELLQFRLIELINLYNLSTPKLLVMMADLDLNYSDATNLEFLVDNILATKLFSPDNIKFLTLNPFACEFFTENPSYNKIEVVYSLTEALSVLLPEIEDGTEMAMNILDSKNSKALNEGLIETRFKIDIHKNLSIAIVDDDPLMWKIMQTVFTGKATVSTFSSGQEFLNEFSDDSYDLVFLDMMMPGLTGLETLIKIKEKGARTPFVILSAVTQREVIVKALEKGAKRYVVKPVTKELILKKTEEVLGAVF